MLTKTMLASGLALALTVPAVGLLASEVLEPVTTQNQEQNELMVTTKDAVATQNQGEDIQIRVQERNQIRQDAKAQAGTQTPAGDQDQTRNRLQLQDPENCLNSDRPNADGLATQERATVRNNDEAGPHGPQAGIGHDAGDDTLGGNGPNGVQDGTGPIEDRPENGAGNQYGK